MVSDPIKKIGFGERVVNYQGDDTIDSLVIPPDLNQAKFTRIVCQRMWG